MNELQTSERQLPDNLPDLAKFALVGREKLQSVRAEIRAIDKLNLAQEVHEQKLSEAQDIADAVLDAEVKIGELTAKIEKTQGQRNELLTTADKKSKHETIIDIGLTDNAVSRFERMAKHPEIVQKAKEEARENGEIVTRQDVLNRIATPLKKKKDFVEQAKEEHEQFEEQKKNGVLNFEDARNDKDNKEIINLDTQIKVRKAVHKITDLLFMDITAVNEMITGLEKEEKATMLKELNDAIDVLTKIKQKMEVLNG